jgi:hypothetical protein
MMRTGVAGRNRMSRIFLENFMYAARKITSAECGLAVDAQLKPVVFVDPEHDDADPATLGQFALDCLRQAMTSGEAIITNNVITDPAEAPSTNTSFTDLKVVVALPVAHLGAIYLDRHIRKGIIPKQMVDRLMWLVSYSLGAKREDCSEAELIEMYEQIK